MLTTGSGFCRRLEAAKLEIVAAYKVADLDRRLLMLLNAVEVFKGGVAAGDKRMPFFLKVGPAVNTCLCGGCRREDSSPCAA